MTHESVNAQMPTDLAGEPTTATVDDLTLQLTPWKTATPGRIRIAIRLEASSGNLAGIHLDYGDGTVDPSRLDGCYSAGPGFVPRAPYDQTISFDHTYRAAGDYVASVTALFASTCPPPSTPRAIAGQVSLHVDDGPGATNGPSQPEVYARIDRVDAGPDNHGYAVAAVFSAWDDDGWAGAVVVDWGDGVQTTAHNPATCPTSIVGYPNGQFNASGSGIPIHDYGSPGTRTITLTVISSGCGGSDTQMSTTSIATTLA